jgi:hypothetical protein
VAALCLCRRRRRGVHILSLFFLPDIILYQCIHSLHNNNNNNNNKINFSFYVYDFLRVYNKKQNVTDLHFCERKKNSTVFYFLCFKREKCCLFFLNSAIDFFVRVFKLTCQAELWEFLLELLRLWFWRLCLTMTMASCKKFQLRLIV